MKRRVLNNNRGFTLAELLLATLFGLVVMTTLYSFYRDQLFFLLSQETKTATLEDTRGALSLMVRELRQAGSWGAGAAPSGCSRVATATATTIRFQADLDGNDDCSSATGEDVTYAFSTTSSSDCPGDNVTREGDCLVANITRPTGKLFTYFDASGNALADSPPVTDIKRIQITFAVQETNPNPSVGGTVSSTLSSSVLLRN